MSSNVIPFDQQCQATRKDGTPCRARPVAGGEYCVGHLPHAREVRARGGHNRSNAARSLKMIPARLRPVADTISHAIDEVHAGELDPRVASAMAALASVYVRLIQAGEMEERLRRLEQAAADAAPDEVA